MATKRKQKTAKRATQKKLEKIKGLRDLETLAAVGRKTLSPDKMKVMVGASTCGVASGAQDTYEAAIEFLSSNKTRALIEKTGCIGFCQKEPLLYIQNPGEPLFIFCEVTTKDAVAILNKFLDGKIDEKKLLGCIDPHGICTTKYRKLESLDFYSLQKKIALKNCGLINPDSIEEYIAVGGYMSLYKTLGKITPEDLIKIVTESGLRGRGGGGFMTGWKWESCRKAYGKKKYVICNADEGDPGAYMDRSLLEGDPHCVIEGMIIGAYAVGAHEGFIYVRNEYPKAIEKISRAIGQAEKYGLLGKNIMGSGFDFTIEINRGGGAFVCGESTALMASLEGKAGEPRAKYIHTVESGLWGMPSNLNNVETWANVPYIIEHGAEKFASIGTEHSKGTKVFSLVGDVVNAGLIEVPMGITLREIIFKIGGGIRGGKKFKAVQTGGPSGGCLPESCLDLPVDFQQLTKAGSMMGSGGMIVMSEDSCMVDVARYFIDFLMEESCGKCVPCREGIRNMSEILNRICAGKGRNGDIELLEELSLWTIDSSLCALGGSAPNPVLSTIKYFRDEYESHISDRKCPAGVCKALINYSIDPVKCTGCHACFSACPVDAISGKPKQLHVIDTVKCIKCNSCYEVCNFEAVRR